MFASPVRGGVLPEKAVRTAGQFIVTRSFAEHVRLTPQGLGMDIGNGRSGGPVLAQEAGRVIYAGPLGVRNPPQLGDGALTVTIMYDNRWEGSYTHLSQIGVRVGQRVGRVASILGSVGASGYGITAPHLHYHNKDPQGRHHDPFPLIDQNELPDTGTGDDVNLKGTVIEWIHNRTTRLTAAAGFTEDPTAMPYNNLVILPNGTAFTPSVKVRGNTLAGTNEWYGGWITGNPPRFGYIILANCGPLVAIEQAGGYTQAQLDAAVDKAEASAGKEAATDVAGAAVNTAKKYAP